MRYLTKNLTAMGLGMAVLILSACGTPAIAVNPYNPGGAVAVASATTPTSAVNPILVTPTSNNAQNGASPTTAAVQNAAPTMTLAPPTATQVSVSNPTVPAAATTPAASANSGDPARGQALFQGAATCSSCHDVANGVTIVGPSLKGVANACEDSCRPGQSIADYLRESIVSPNAFIVPGFQPNIMPQTFAKTLSTQQINDLVAYLLTLK
ncbi:MAG: c-type cytochrome [Aggregatilineales bacterium]